MFSSLNNSVDSKSANYLLARVVENNDPLFMQRIKVVIPEKLEGGVDDLPWLLPLHPHVAGFGTTYGVVNVPPVGAQVTVEFQNGSPYYGLVIGSVPEKRFDPGPLKTNYPNRRGWIDPQGNYFYIDNTAGQNEIEVFHASGTRLRILNSGEVQIFTQSNTKIDVTGNADVSVRGSTSVQSDGALSVKTNSTMSLESSGAMSLRSNAGISMNAPRIDANKS